MSQRSHKIGFACKGVTYYFFYFLLIAYVVKVINQLLLFRSVGLCQTFHFGV